jgi:DNA-directed RNA polymerase I subunit RPA49
LVPEHDIDALNPSDIYPLHNMIPKPEWKALSISNYMSAGGDMERVALLPFKRSHWINDHLALAFASSSPNKTTMYVEVVFHDEILLKVYFQKNVNIHLNDDRLPQCHL